MASTYAVFAIFSSRAATALPKLPGDSFTGIINCDRARMYWRAKRLQEMKPVRDTVNDLLLRGKFSGNKRLKGMCSDLYGHRDWPHSETLRLSVALCRR